MLSMDAWRSIHDMFKRCGTQHPNSLAVVKMGTSMSGLLKSVILRSVPN
jgi:hypothetical protein